MIKTIEKYAKKHGLSSAIVYGICKQESSLNPLAVRYEPNYKWLFNPEEVKPKFCSLQTEETLQKFSFGLMQVMGAVYREYGLKGWLTTVVNNIDLQLEYGCLYLAQKIKKHGLNEGILSYNSGSPRKNQSGEYINVYYLNKVFAYAKEYVSLT